MSKPTILEQLATELAVQNICHTASVEHDHLEVQDSYDNEVAFGFADGVLGWNTLDGANGGTSNLRETDTVQELVNYIDDVMTELGRESRNGGKRQ